MMQSKVLLYMELPPPMHGMTYINKIIYDNLVVNENYAFYETDFSLDVGEVGNVSLKKIFKNFSIIFGAWKKFFSVKPDVVYSLLSASLFGICRDFMINLPAMLFRKRLVLHLHGFTYYKIYSSSFLYRKLFDIMSQNATLIVLCEKQKAKTLEVMSKESIVLANCLATSEIKKKKEKNEITRICYISNISKAKGTFDLIEAVKSSSKPLHLLIAGNFLDDEEEFFKAIEGFENISYLGFADEEMKDKILSTSDIFCLPSKLEEGSPVSIVEAMSYGLPIIATDKGCIEDMVKNCGYVLNSKNVVSEIIKGIEFIEKSYKILSLNAFKEYIGNYSHKKFIDKFKNILQEKI